MQRSTRVDYDAIAELDDSTPHREKSADPELIAFLAGRARRQPDAARHRMRHRQPADR